MSKVERLYHLHNILNQRRTPISRQDLMERLECSQATLYRLVGELRDFLGAPIEQDPDTRGFYYDRDLEQAFDLPGIWISPAELQALLTARQVLSNVQPGLLEGELESLQGRITSLLRQKGIITFHTICGRTKQSVLTDQMSVIPPLELCDNSEVN